jgi:hypothetical protein
MFLADLNDMPREWDNVPIIHMRPRTIVSMGRVVAVGTQAQAFVLVSAECSDELIYQEMISYPSDQKFMWEFRYRRFFRQVTDHIVAAVQTVPRSSIWFFRS